MESRGPPSPSDFRSSTVRALVDELSLRYTNQVLPQGGGSFYAVYLPPEGPKRMHPSLCVFFNKAEAMKCMKLSKRARFRAFKDHDMALAFATDGYVDPPRSPERKNGYSTNINQNVINERLSPYKAPKPQDLVKLRKTIENGELDHFWTMIWSNPRYLVSNGDTPSILQEGFRYNALHVAAKAKNARLAEAVLNVICNRKFITQLYGEDYVCDNIDARIQVLLDLYLNTPDKGNNETPLHFASKYGAPEVVEVLVAFPECDKTLKNKYGQTADVIICDRCDKNEELEHVKQKIALLLGNCFYVPVLRSEDDSLPPSIGEPFSPGKSSVFEADPLSPRFEIHAYAGPMNKEGADHFRKVWKTPPRMSTPTKRKPDADGDESLQSILALRYTDTNKGLERMGQTLANKFHVNWKEYWPFLDSFVDITSEEGLLQLEQHLRGRYIICDKMCASDEDIKANSPVADLCLALQRCEISSRSTFGAYLAVEKACDVFGNRLATKLTKKRNTDFITFITCIEMQAMNLELCMTSFMDDERFKDVNFSVVHYRVAMHAGHEIAFLCANELKVEIMQVAKKYLGDCINSYEIISSDDETFYLDINGRTPIPRQTVCILEQFLDNFDLDTKPQPGPTSERSCREAFARSKKCKCAFDIHRPRKSIGPAKQRLRGLKSSRKLNYSKQSQNNDDSWTDDEYFTPPTSPHDSDLSEDEYSDAPPPQEVFVEYGRPTKTDNALYKALTYANCKITPDVYPNIYRWYHNVNLYTEKERKSWRAKPKDITPTKCTSLRSKTPQPRTPPNSTSWLRITGTHSPQASYQRKIYF